MNFTVFSFIFSQGLPGPPGEKGENGGCWSYGKFLFSKIDVYYEFH